MTNKFNKAIKYIFLCVASFISIFPFFWMIVSATNKSVDVTRGKLSFGSSFMENLNNLLKPDLGFVTSLINSGKIAIITTILALIVSSVAGYGFEIFRTKARDRVFTVLLLSMMVPFSAIMIPLFKLFSSLKNSPLSFIGVNTMGAIILPSVCTAFLIFFFRQNTKTFPKEILEAARIDGLGEVGIFIKIFCPTMKTTYAAAAIITFMGAWNAYLWPLIGLQSPEKWTVLLTISKLASSYSPDYGLIMIAIVITTLPTALVFFVMQKHFVAGMTGSIK
ncbi:carbohydrate ABC transporter permease [Clostridium saccharoperbutylacetonicum]|jgi:lactose/L-arabinose transport system permease protein|uniref:carbohydrate ABC transporter permease n=1 Tax=Clostridium saccharoperbutylacetonicum TaxID=36745 RepID=UPI000983E536|nr:carbohydrate ABC transporter permease [Clostridium saccharoperbutylacetonicum]AQR93561.1 lactose transport system permease protein LacG [Clostridium saccharoperbutylacetonicum]NSB29260.1 lactose/L-arabinose transport system permease protein [Clostridium saccharoperbutylacetonicum]